MNVNGKSKSNKLRVAYNESGGRHVHILPCANFGTPRSLFSLAKALGFDGADSTFWQRLKNSDGKKTLAELSLPSKKSNSTTKKRTQSDEVAAAIAALNARKAAMR